MRAAVAGSSGPDAVRLLMRSCAPPLKPFSLSHPAGLSVCIQVHETCVYRQIRADSVVQMGNTDSFGHASSALWPEVHRFVIPADMLIAFATCQSPDR